MIKVDARQKEQELFDRSIKLKLLAFDAATYEQALKIRQDYNEMYKKQQFYKMLIKLCDNTNKEENNAKRLFIK